MLDEWVSVYGVKVYTHYTYFVLEQRNRLNGDGIGHFEFQVDRLLRLGSIEVPLNWMRTILKFWNDFSVSMRKNEDFVSAKPFCIR